MRHYFFLFLSAALLQLAGRSSASVEDTCARAAKSDPRVSYDSCVHNLYRHPQATEGDDWRLAQIAAELATNNSEVGEVDFQDMAKQTADPVLKKLLTACSETYDEMGLADARAEQKIRERDYDAADKQLDLAISLAQKCESSFGQAGKASPVSVYTSEAVNLAILSEAINNLMK